MTASSNKVVDFYFDFLSPFSYLASHGLKDIAVRNSLSINYHAIDLARAKLAIGNTGVSNRDMPVKLAYLFTDARRWAEKYQVPLEVIPNFNSGKLNTGMYYCKDDIEREKYVDAAFYYTWGKGSAPDDVVMLEELANTMEWDVNAFMEFLDSDEGQARYETATTAAIERKVFGVPTMCIDDEMWWGNDRLFMIEEKFEP